MFYRVDFTRTSKQPSKDNWMVEVEVKDKGFVFFSANSEAEKEFLVKDFLGLCRKVTADYTVVEVSESEVNREYFGWGKEFSEILSDVSEEIEEIKNEECAKEAEENIEEKIAIEIANKSLFITKVQITKDYPNFSAEKIEKIWREFEKIRFCYTN